MQDNLIDQGINLMLFGMGTVFVFLTVLVFATTLMSKVVNRLAPEEVKETSATMPNDTSLQSAQTNINPRTLEAIKLAIKAHRSK
jgi:oxaloacetate decarboxylase gamma subunit